MLRKFYSRTPLDAGGIIPVSFDAQPLLARPAAAEGLVYPTNAVSAYEQLTDGADPDADAHFDLHVIACIFALGFAEARAGQETLTARVGLDPVDLGVVVDRFFPHAAAWLFSIPSTDVMRGPDEACLVDLLSQCATDGSEFEVRLAAMVARRAQGADHLWQDLGLRNHGELSRLMNRYIRPLAARNNGDMKWKKFLYRMIFRDAGYSICTAPSCAECDDFETCFSDETGESRLARVRRINDLADRSLAEMQRRWPCILLAWRMWFVR